MNFWAQEHLRQKYLILQYAGYVDIKKRNFQLLQMLLS